MLLAAGIALWIVVFVDVVAAVVAVNARGRLSATIAHGVWLVVCKQVLQRIVPRAAALAGPIVLSAVVVFWIVGTWANWVIIFRWGEPGVVNSQTGEPAGLVQTIAYAGSKLSTLGSGLAQAGSPAWDAVSILPAINGMVLLSLAASYALSLVGVVTRARTLAVRISGNGDEGSGRPAEIDLDKLESQCLRVTVDLSAYPLASYFSTADPAAHIPTAILKLARQLPDVRRSGLDTSAGSVWSGLETLTGHHIGAFDNRSDLKRAVARWYTDYSLYALPDWWDEAGSRTRLRTETSDESRAQENAA